MLEGAHQLFVIIQPRPRNLPLAPLDVEFPCLLIIISKPKPDLISIGEINPLRAPRGSDPLRGLGHQQGLRHRPGFCRGGLQLVLANRRHVRDPYTHSGFRHEEAL